MLICTACEQEHHDLCTLQFCDCDCAGEAEDYFDRDMPDEGE